jgi:hypothetical protein
MARMEIHCLAHDETCTNRKKIAFESIYKSQQVRKGRKREYFLVMHFIFHAPPGGVCVSVWDGVSRTLTVMKRKWDIVHIHRDLNIVFTTSLLMVRRLAELTTL